MSTTAHSVDLCSKSNKTSKILEQQIWNNNKKKRQLRPLSGFLRWADINHFYKIKTLKCIFSDWSKFWRELNKQIKSYLWILGRNSFIYTHKIYYYLDYREKYSIFLRIYVLLTVETDIWIISTRMLSIYFYNRNVCWPISLLFQGTLRERKSMQLGTYLLSG
jgi:hypothetical protein